MFDAIARVEVAWLSFTLLAVLACSGFLAGRRIADERASAGRLTSAQPNELGVYLAMWMVVPAAFLCGVYLIFGEALVRVLLAGDLPAGFAALSDEERRQYVDRAGQAAWLPAAPFGADPLFNAVTERYRDLRGQAKASLLAGGALLAGLGFLRHQARLRRSEVRARVHLETGVRLALLLCAAIAIATTVGIVVSLLFESLRFFALTPPTEFLFGLEWNAQTGEAFGAVPLFFGTFMIALVAMCVAGPIGLFVAIYLSEYAGRRARAFVKPVLEVLAGIPTVVYGFFALIVVAPAVRSGALALNAALERLPFVEGPVLAAQPTNALAAGLVMGVMIIPYVSSLSDDAIRAVPRRLRDGAFAIGATPSEAIRHVVLPAAFPGIAASLLLAISRAIGETMIVVMAAGQRAQISMDPTSDFTTITAQIVSLLVGDSAFDSQRTLSAFALGLVLFMVTLFFNLIALRIVNRRAVRYG